MSVAKKIFESFKPNAPAAHRSPSCGAPSRGLSDSCPVNGLVVLVPDRLAAEVIGPLAFQPGQMKADEGQRQAGGNRRDLFGQPSRQRDEQLSVRLGPGRPAVADPDPAPANKPEPRQDFQAPVLPRSGSGYQPGPVTGPRHQRM